MENQIYKEPFQEHKQSTPDSPLVILDLTMKAAPEKIFQSLTNSELIKQWWGPQGFSCPVARGDFRQGGTYLFCMQQNGGQEQIFSTGEFLKFDPPRSLVMSDAFANAEGEKQTPTTGPFADMGEAYITIELSPIDENETRLILSHEGLPARMHEDCVDGWTSSLNKLKRLVEGH